MMRETARHGKEGADLAKGDHHGVNDNTHDEVGDERADRSRAGQGTTKTNKETSADGAA